MVGKTKCSVIAILMYDSKDHCLMTSTANSFLEPFQMQCSLFPFLRLAALACVLAASLAALARARTRKRSCAAQPPPFPFSLFPFLRLAALACPPQVSAASLDALARVSAAALRNPPPSPPFPPLSLLLISFPQARCARLLEASLAALARTQKR